MQESWISFSRNLFITILQYLFVSYETISPGSNSLNISYNVYRLMSEHLLVHLTITRFTYWGSGLDYDTTYYFVKFQKSNRFEVEAYFQSCYISLCFFKIYPFEVFKDKRQQMFMYFVIKTLI